MKTEELDMILAQVAHMHHTTVQQVRKDIEFSMEDAQKSTDPTVQALWASIPRSGETPTLEEFMDFMIQRLKNS